MKEKELYEKIIQSISYNVKKALLERDDDEYEEPDYPQSSFNAVWEGIYDITTDEVIDLYDFTDPGIDPATDEWNGIHQYVLIEVRPESWDEYYRPADYFNPAEGDLTITSYDISEVDGYLYTTNEYNGKYYYESEESTRQRFEGFTDEQIKNIENYIKKNIRTDWWDWDFPY